MLKELPRKNLEDLPSKLQLFLWHALPTSCKPQWAQFAKKEHWGSWCSQYVAIINIWEFWHLKDYEPQIRDSWPSVSPDMQIVSTTSITRGSSRVRRFLNLHGEKHAHAPTNSSNLSGWSRAPVTYFTFLNKTIAERKRNVNTPNKQILNSSSFPNKIYYSAIGHFNPPVSFLLLKGRIHYFKKFSPACSDKKGVDHVVYEKSFFFSSFLKLKIENYPVLMPWISVLYFKRRFDKTLFLESRLKGEEAHVPVGGIHKNSSTTLNWNWFQKKKRRNMSLSRNMTIVIFDPEKEIERR